MKKNYISKAALAGLLSLTLISCSKKKEDKKDTTTTTSVVDTTTSQSSTSHISTDTTTSTNAGVATLKVYDFDGEELFNGDIQAGDTLYNVLSNTKGIEAVYADTQYGHQLLSINGSIMSDYNLSLMIYENGQFGDGVDRLSVDNGDIIEIRNEFWNTQYDDIDVKLDQTIYKYIKTAYKDVEEEYENVVSKRLLKNE